MIRKLGFYAFLSLAILLLACGSTNAPAVKHVVLTSNVQHAANIDYVPGGYGQYNSSDLSNPNIQGVDVNVNWSSVETSQGVFNWSPLDNVLKNWSAAGKHVVLVVRYANEETGGGCPGGILPTWVTPQIAWYCDTDLNSSIPNFFGSNFQSLLHSYIAAIGTHIEASPYKSAIQYVRVGLGLGGEGFYLTYNQNDFNTDKQKLINWGYSQLAWQTYQENLINYAQAQMPGITLIYPIVKLDNDQQLTTAEWALDHGYGIGQEAIPPGSYSTDYAKIKEICAYRNANHPTAYEQFQTENGITSESQVSGDISNAESLRGEAIEWYENVSIVSGYQNDFAGYQTYVTNTFG